MKMTDVVKLNRTVAGFTRSSPSDIEASAWYLVLRDLDYQDAEQAVIDHFTGPDKHAFFEVGYILDGIKRINRHLPHQIEEDVRSAKARGMLDQSWPKHEPLPPEVARRLRNARASFAEQMAAIEARPEGTWRVPELDLGKRVPRE